MPERFRAPGRVNLIGGQVDYHEGWVVSMAIDRDVVVTARPRTDGRVVGRSHDLEGVVDVAADASDDPRAVQPAWGRTIGGIVQVLAALGRASVGADLEITSTVPIGGGLSSSAAFEVAVALGLCEVAGFSVEPRELALAAQRAEHVATGVPCGNQDQLASVFGQAGHALVLDCRTLEIETLALPRGLRVLVVHCGVPRTLEDSPYAQRRAESIEVGSRLGLRALRDATFEQVRDQPRGRHAVTEMARVRAFADALREGALDELGPLMLASHASSRDDMDVSIPELDTLVECLVEAGALGARLTGAGFGGCVVALVPADEAGAIAATASAAYRKGTGREPTPWIVDAANGAGPL
ncbi:MAG: galactokinase [Acidimicrobiia bacterium]